MSDAVTRLLDSSTVADLLNVSLRTLESWRLNGSGPNFVKIGRGRTVRYRQVDVQAWIDARVRKSTSDSGFSATASNGLEGGE